MKPMRPGGADYDQTSWRLGIMKIITNDHQDEHCDEAKEHNHTTDPGVAFETRHGFSTRPNDVDLK
jgi:hypothetical protein